MPYTHEHRYIGENKNQRFVLIQDGSVYEKDIYPSALFMKDLSNLTKFVNLNEQSGSFLLSALFQKGGNESDRLTKIVADWEAYIDNCLKLKAAAKPVKYPDIDFFTTQYNTLLSTQTNYTPEEYTQKKLAFAEAFLSSLDYCRRENSNQLSAHNSKQSNTKTNTK